MAEQLVIPRVRQEPWGWPAAANFFLGGSGTGYYLVSLLDSALKGGSAAPSPASVGLLAALLVALGFIALAVEAGRPLRGYHAARSVGRSWMSRETWSIAVFLSAAVLDSVHPHIAFRIAASASALMVMATQGFILYRSRAVAAWNVPVMPVLFLTSGLASGSGVLLIGADGGGGSLAAPAALGLVFGALNAAVWLLYLKWSPLPDYRAATGALRRPLALVLTLGIGAVLPLILLLIVAGGQALGAESIGTLAAVSGGALLAGGAAQKAWVVMKAGYLREIVIKR